MRILIVEDSESARVMIRDMLSLKGHEVVAEVGSLDQALEAYRKHKPDLVTLDLALGQESGLALMKSILAADKAAKVLVITGNAQTFIRDQAVAAGAAGFVTKPITISELELAIALAASRKK